MITISQEERDRIFDSLEDPVRREYIAIFNDIKDQSNDLFELILQSRAINLAHSEVDLTDKERYDPNRAMQFYGLLCYDHSAYHNKKSGRIAKRSYQ